MSQSISLQDFRVITIGASAGGYHSVLSILGHFSEKVNAAFFVVIHGGFRSVEGLVANLKKSSSLNVLSAQHNQEIKPGNVYLSQPEKHLAVHEGKMILTAGPRENLFRPAIDVLFRSAAVAYGNRCIAVLLSGRLNDGTAGLDAVIKCGGTVIIQDPESAAFPDMPRYALSVITADHILDLQGIQEQLARSVNGPLPAQKQTPAYLERENQLSWEISSQVETEEHLGNQVAKSCPSCGGPLWQLDEESTGFPRYRCHVGHAFSREALLEGQDSSIERAMWISLRTLEEKRNLLERMLSDYQERDLKSLVSSYSDKLEEVKTNIKSIRRVMEINE